MSLNNSGIIISCNWCDVNVLNSCGFVAGGFSDSGLNILLSGDWLLRSCGDIYKGLIDSSITLILTGCVGGVCDVWGGVSVFGCVLSTIKFILSSELPGRSGVYGVLLLTSVA